MSTDIPDFETVLKQGIEKVPAHLEQLAAAQGFVQKAEPGEIRWLTGEGELRALFYAVIDPRDLAFVAQAYKRTRETGCPFTWILVHQWCDGGGNWDIFTIRPENRMEHRGRVWGGREVPDRKPHLRDDVYRLFETDSPFPPPGGDGWAKLLGGPRAALAGRLDELAAARRCAQTDDGRSIFWRGKDGALEAMFELIPDPSDLDAFIRVYDRIAAFLCPVTFLFVERAPSKLYDIFRLSGRSYLEHHNEAESTGRREGGEDRA